MAQTAMAEQRTEKRKTKVPRKWVALSILAFIAAVLLGIFYTFRAQPQFAVSVSASFSQPIRRTLGKLCSLTSLSVTEIFYTLAILAALILLVRIIWLFIKKRPGAALHRICVLLLCASYIWVGFCWLWGIDYFCPSFSEKSGLVSDGVTAEELEQTTRHFLENANRLAPEQPRDENGVFAPDIDACFRESVHVYDALEAEFPCLAAESNVPKKMFYSAIMSRMGFTGIYFPFTGESNINVAAPDGGIPFTIAHELAHQRCVYSEAEANFLGIAACTSSGSTVYEYSGYFSGLIYLMNAIYRVDPELWTELAQDFSPQLKQDWNQRVTYWQGQRSAVTTASETVYDGYLKAQGQDLGIASYGACVDLLVAYYCPTK